MSKKKAIISQNRQQLAIEEVFRFFGKEVTSTLKSKSGAGDVVIKLFTGETIMVEIVNCLDGNENIPLPSKEIQKFKRDAAKFDAALLFSRQRISYDAILFVEDYMVFSGGLFDSESFLQAALLTVKQALYHGMNVGK